MNEENNIELPKRIDDVPSSPEPESIIPDEVIVNPEINPDLGQTIIPENIISNDLQPLEAPIAAGGIETTNIFNQNTEINNPVTENIVTESRFEPIPDLEEPSIPINNELPQEEIQTLVTPENPATEEEIVVPVVEATNLEEIPVSENTVSNEPLDKKLVVEDSVKKEKSKGNPIVGFFALLLILAIILAAFYYFVKMDYIKLPDEIKNKIPFFTTTITTTVNNNNNNNEEDLNSVSVVGDYLEAEPVVCPDVATKLLLKDDGLFSYNKLSLNLENNDCDVTEVVGNYTASEGNLKLTPTDNPVEIINATYKKTQVTVEISIPTEDGKTILLYDINQR